MKSDIQDKIIVLPDIHGDYKKLMQVMRRLYKKGLRFKGTNNVLIQLGDRVDRGPDSYRVNRFFLKLQKQYPSQIQLIFGNHESMMFEAATSRVTDHNHIFYYNGGDKTLKSYARATKEYGKNRLYHSIVKAGHWELLIDPVMYIETDEYFFCHAPIPRMEYREGLARLAPDAFLRDKDTLIWSYVDGVPTEQWVDPDLFNGKICIYGHIHGIKLGRNGNYEFPHPIRIGNAILLDSGCGCHHSAPLTALILPDLITIDNDGLEKDDLSAAFMLKQTV